jgi:membrane-associated phospholipid phosphatase
VWAIATTLLLVILLLVLGWRQRQPQRPGGVLFRHTSPQWKRCYGRRSFLRLAAGVAGAGALAYSGLDELLEEAYATGLRSSGTDRLSRLVKPWGENDWFLIWGGVALLDAHYHSSAFSRWGRDNFEALVLGVPMLWSVQYGLGAARPSDRTHGPRWRPFADENSASGHTYIAAVPWLNLARRSDRRAARVGAYTGSLLTGWSRLNDRMHYPSQIALGYEIAWLATSAVAGPDTTPPSHSPAR